MEVILADKLGFCFGVKRAIRLTEKIAILNKNTVTLGPLIHNSLEIDRLKFKFGVDMKHGLEGIKENQNVIIRTHGITKQDLSILNEKNIKITDATCPYVTSPQKIVEEMSKLNYTIVIFGDAIHPEVKGVMSYSYTEPIVVSNLDEAKENIKKISKRIAIVSQTTKQVNKFMEIVNYLIPLCSEVRVFNTICNATFENQEATKNLSLKADVMIVVGGKASSNTKQLFYIAKQHCENSYLIENENDLDINWFIDKKICGIAAGASTPDWIIKAVKERIENIETNNKQDKIRLKQ